MSINVTVTRSDFAKNAKEKAIAIRSGIMKAANKAVRETTDIFYKEVYDNISMQMHGSFPEDHYYYLRKYYDSPFSSIKHVSIQPHGHEPTWSVHVVYGIMRRELHKKVEFNETSAIGWIGWLYGHSNEVEWVIKGTRKMLPRPVLRLTASDINLKQLLNDNFMKYYK